MGKGDVGGGRGRRGCEGISLWGEVGDVKSQVVRCH